MMNSFIETVGYDYEGESCGKKNKSRVGKFALFLGYGIWEYSCVVQTKKNSSSFEQRS